MAVPAAEDAGGRFDGAVAAVIDWRRFGRR